MSDFSNWNTVITRKDHTCNGCLAKIPKGTEVTHGSGKFEGSMFACYLCADCDKFLQENPDVREEGFCDGDIGMARREEGESNE